MNGGAGEPRGGPVGGVGVVRSVARSGVSARDRGDVRADVSAGEVVLRGEVDDDDVADITDEPVSGVADPSDWSSAQPVATATVASVAAEIKTRVGRR